jgi:hypothetical protein
MPVLPMNATNGSGGGAARAASKLRRKPHIADWINRTGADQTHGRVPLYERIEGEEIADAVEMSGPAVVTRELVWIAPCAGAPTASSSMIRSRASRKQTGETIRDNVWDTNVTDVRLRFNVGDEWVCQGAGSLARSRRASPRTSIGQACCPIGEEGYT